MKKKSICLVACLLIISSVVGATEVITIDKTKTGALVPRSLYGIFFEEITHSGDGGLYAEMVLNRGFEDGNPPSGMSISAGHACASHLPCYSNDTINKFRIDAKSFDAMNGWSVECGKGAMSSYTVVADHPLNSATPHSIRIDAQEAASQIRLINSGYNGIATGKGKKYDLEFYLRTSAYEGAVEAALIDKQGLVVVSTRIEVLRTPGWHHYLTTLVSPVEAGDLRLALYFEPSGRVWVDYVSLFPQETFKGRKNGLRCDVAQMLTDLKPGFIRWPGGCIVEGATMENRVKWKETIGAPVTRPGEYNLWGYRSTYGFGYHEFLQFCEDTDADAMFVCNAGMSCLFRNGDYASFDLVDDLIREALDAIEYAIGGVDTEWGALRAVNGHPEPFALKYVEIGNENIGSRYAANYNRFHRVIKAKYPQITLISALMFSKNIEELDEVEFIDPHYYETADWFYNNASVYDKLPADLPYKVYVGEYAAIGRTSLYSSLAEAAFLTGVERNADKVQLVSYAPLLENASFGRDHLMVLDNRTVYGRTNYYMMKMFCENIPDVNLSTKIKGAPKPLAVRPSGFVGISTGNTAAQFKDFMVKKNGKIIYRTHWSDLASRWHIERGEWSVKDGVLTQPVASGDALIWLEDLSVGDCTIEMKACKISGYEGFRVVFGGQDNHHYFMADMGSHTNESVLFREIGDKGSVSLFDYRNQEPVYANHWYDVRIEIRGNNWKCYMDGDLKYEYTYSLSPKHYTVAGYDIAKKEIIVKMVNAEQQEWQTVINLKNAGIVTGQIEKIELSSASINDENSFETPYRIVPVSSKIEVDKSSFDFTCAPNSVAILRIPTNK